MKDEIIVYKVHLFSMPEVPEKPIKFIGRVSTIGKEKLLQIFLVDLSL